MGFLSLYEWLFESKNGMKFISPELDYSELFRLFNYFNDKLPENIDKSLFNKKKYYAQVIPEEMNNIIADRKFNVNNGLSIKKKIDKKWHPFIDFLYEKFKNGEKKIIDKNFLKNVYFGENYKSNDQSFHNFIKNPNYREKLQGDLKDYFKSFDWFDKNPDKIPIPVILDLEGKYYLVGGNRRLCWLLSKKLEKIPVWII